MDKIPDVVGRVLDELAKHFGSTGQHLWQVLVTQYHLHAVVQLWSAAGFGLFGVLSFVFAGIADAPDNAAAMGLLGTVLTLIAICCLAVGFCNWYNPEYGALQQVLTILKGGK